MKTNFPFFPQAPHLRRQLIKVVYDRILDPAPLHWSDDTPSRADKLSGIKNMAINAVSSSVNIRFLLIFRPR